MNDVWFGPGLTSDDYDAFLDALSLDRRNGAPLIAVATLDGQSARLVMASRSFFNLFGVGTSEALSGRLLNGRDPGARRLADLFRSLPLGGAPRLERLRFALGFGSEIITFLCRRLKMPTGEPVFVAAALGVRPGLLPVVAPVAKAPPAPAQPVTMPAASEPAPRPAPVERADIDQPMDVAAIHAALAARWPSTRRVRFVWQSDADGTCRQVSEQLAAIVGKANGDLVDRNLPDLAPSLDPSGKLAEALASRATWSGIEVNWPIADASGAVAVGLGAVPMLDANQNFQGFRGYGVIHLDRVSEHAQVVLGRVAEPSPPPTRAALGNVVPFPNPPRGFSDEDHLAFAALAAELRDQAGLPEPEPEPEPEPLAPTLETASAAQAAAEPPSPPAATETAGIAHDLRGNGLAVLDRLALGLLVSRDNVPIFANRFLLDTLGFANEDALHEAGGLAHLFGPTAPEMPDDETLHVRGRDGTSHPVRARLQTIDWDGLPATLLTLEPAGADQALAADHEAAMETLSRDHAEEGRRHEADVRRLRAILETATDGVVIIDASGDVLSLNRSAEALFGRDRGTVTGKPFLDLFAPDNQGLARDYLDGLTTSPTRSLLNDGREILVKAPQGGTIPVFMTLGRLDVPAEGTGEDAHLCALFRDLTHWKKVETELETAKQDAEAASAAKTDFLATVSHEVRTPLNAIIGFAEVILEERFGPIGSDRYREYLRDIHASGTHVMSLINDLLDLSKIEAGRMELNPTAIDANKVITECVALMQPQASRERVIMRLSLAPNLPKIRADERSLRQIVLNLLSNAVKYNEPGGQVIVATAAPEDGKVLIRVRDTGAGMSEADVAAALEPFRQVSSRPLTEGTGLGLPLTKALVEANEANFSIRSKLEHGTLAEVAFPPARVLAGQR